MLVDLQVFSFGPKDYTLTIECAIVDRSHFAALNAAMPKATAEQLGRIAALAAARNWTHEDVLFAGFLRAAIPQVDHLGDLTSRQASELIACLDLLDSETGT